MSSLTQICNKCNKEKDLSNYYIRSDTGKHRKECKECGNNIKKNRREVLKEKNSKLEIDITQTKICTQCNISKTINLFSKKNDSVSGIYSWCLECSSNKYKIQKRNIVDYSDTDKKKCSKCNIEKSVIDNFSKKHSRDGYSNLCKLCVKQYKKDNSKEIYQKKKHKLENDIQFKLAERIRARLRTLLNAKVLKPKTEELIGCSLDDLIKHLNRLCYSNIIIENSGKNHGKVWQLDHIIPCNYFNLNNFNELKACTHYTNLQPLLIKDNSIKSDNLDWIHPKSGYQITFLRLIYSGFLTFKYFILLK
jgi:hypothetical protein